LKCLDLNRLIEPASHRLMRQISTLQIHPCRDSTSHKSYHSHWLISKHSQLCRNHIRRRPCQFPYILQPSRQESKRDVRSPYVQRIRSGRLFIKRRILVNQVAIRVMFHDVSRGIEPFIFGSELASDAPISTSEVCGM
jgi:hypothetical protein